MSILIKGMEMPKTEEESRLLILTPDGVTCLTKLGTGNQRFDTIEVPPHGRLIDADALLKLIDSCMFPSDMVTTRAVSMATNWIKEAPTVIPADKDGET